MSIRNPAIGRRIGEPKQPEAEHKHDENCEHDHEAIEPFRREDPKVGRNDACPCGSQKKYKKCCGAAA